MVLTVKIVSSNSKITEASRKRMIMIKTAKLLKHLYRLVMPNWGDLVYSLKNLHRKMKIIPSASSSEKLTILRVR